LDSPFIGYNLSIDIRTHLGGNPMPENNSEPSVRIGFRYFNRFMVLMWRLGLGKYINIWPTGLGRIMVLGHTGRHSGLKRSTPVNYAIIEDEIYCTAGFGRISDWYRNIIANPAVEIWLPDGWWTGVAEDITDSPQRLAILRQVLVASGFAARSLGIDANNISDEGLDNVTTNYRLVHIRRTAARTGAGGPGDLAWLWPLSTFLLLVLPIFRPRRRKPGCCSKKATP
jgi:deazaflavin-dependent oxidoreductase (nitroreductase family)